MNLDTDNRLWINYEMSSNKVSEKDLIIEL